MSVLQEKLAEFYLNYDTAIILKEDLNTSEIVNMFKDELEYPEELTNAFLSFKKSYLKSVIMRIKILQKKLDNNQVKNDLLKYNKDLSPILDKLLDDKFKQYENVLIDDKVNEIDDVDELSNNDLIKQFLNEKFEEDEDGEIKLVDIFESFNSYCSENEYEYLDATTFKKLLKSEWGKADGKGEKCLYKGYRYI